MALAIGILLALRTPALAKIGIGSVLHQVQRRSFGEIYLAIAIGFIFFRSLGTPVLYVLPILVITLADSASALVGTSYGRRRFLIDGDAKSMEGTATFFIRDLADRYDRAASPDRCSKRACDPAISCDRCLFRRWWRRNPGKAWIISSCRSAFISSWSAILPQAQVSFWSWLLPLSGSIVLMHGLAPILRLTRHSAQAYTVLIFVILSVTAPFNALLPVAAIFAHVLAQRSEHHGAINADLGMLASTAAVAMLWLFAGELADRNAINLFNLTFMSVAITYVTLMATGRWQSLALVTAAFLALALFALIHFNPADAIWLDPAWLPILPAIVLPIAAVLLMPSWFRTSSSPKAFVLALIVPVVIYVSKGFST